jgi:hypothetical protein
MTSAVGVGDRRKLHDAGVVDENVDAAEFALRAIEHGAHVVGATHVGFDGDRAQLSDEARLHA